MRKKKFRVNRKKAPPARATMEIEDTAHKNANGVAQQTDQAVREGRDWVEFTKQ